MSNNSTIQFLTRSGSLYEYDSKNWAWARLETTKQSGFIRTNQGQCIQPAKIIIGQSVNFVMEPIAEGASFRLVTTSVVMKIREVPVMEEVTCDGWCKNANPVTHIGSKGYAYCESCAKTRNEDRNTSETCRRMRKWELNLLKSSQPLQSYKRVPRPKAAA